MQGINDADESLVTADVLREMTLTKEQLLEGRTKSIIQSLMTSMVGVAKNNGQKVYTANVDPQIQSEVLTGVTAKFESLGYKVTNQPATISGQDVLALSLSWE